MTFQIYKVRTIVPPSGKPYNALFQVSEYPDPAALQSALRMETDKARAAGYTVTEQLPHVVSLGRESVWPVSDDNPMPERYHSVLQFFVNVAFDPSLFFTPAQLRIVRDVLADRLSTITVADIQAAQKAGPEGTADTRLLSVINLIQPQLAEQPFSDLLDFFNRRHEGRAPAAPGSDVVVRVSR